eukprot:SAG11_NODE_22221_length_410_cov_0.591640_1_plen_38_part_10
MGDKELRGAPSVAGSLDIQIKTALQCTPLEVPGASRSH